MFEGRRAVWLLYCSSNLLLSFQRCHIILTLVCGDIVLKTWEWKNFHGIVFCQQLMKNSHIKLTVWNFCCSNWKKLFKFDPAASALAWPRLIIAFCSTISYVSLDIIKQPKAINLNFKLMLSGQTPWRFYKLTNYKNGQWCRIKANIWTDATSISF